MGPASPISRQHMGTRIRCRNSAGMPWVHGTSRPRAGELCVTREPLLPVLSLLPLCKGQAQTQVCPPCPRAELVLKLKAPRASVQFQRCLSLSQAPEPETCEQDLRLRLPAAGTRDLPHPAPGLAENILVALTPRSLPTNTTWPQHSCKLLTNGDGMPLLFANPGKVLGSLGQLLD